MRKAKTLKDPTNPKYWVDPRYFVHDDTVYESKWFLVNPKPDDLEDGICYIAVHKESHKIYIGSTKRGLGARIKQHLSTARSKKGTHFHKLLGKYGKEAFDFKIISRGKMKDMRKLEDSIIAFMRRDFQEYMFNQKQKRNVIKPVIDPAFLKLGHLKIIQDLGELNILLDDVARRGKRQIDSKVNVNFPRWSSRNQYY